MSILPFFPHLYTFLIEMFSYVLWFWYCFVIQTSQLPVKIVFNFCNCCVPFIANFGGGHIPQFLILNFIFIGSIFYIYSWILKTNFIDFFPNALIVFYFDVFFIIGCKMLLKALVFGITINTFQIILKYIFNFLELLTFVY